MNLKVFTPRKLAFGLAAVSLAFLVPIVGPVHDLLTLLEERFKVLSWLFILPAPFVLPFFWVTSIIQSDLAEFLDCERESSLFVGLGPIRCQALPARILLNVSYAVSFALLFGLLYLFWWLILKALWRLSNKAISKLRF